MGNWVTLDAGNEFPLKVAHPKLSNPIGYQDVCQFALP
jgi:hypothetical protein